MKTPIIRAFEYSCEYCHHNRVEADEPATPPIVIELPENDTLWDADKKAGEQGWLVIVPEEQWDECDCTVFCPIHKAHATILDTDRVYGDKNNG